jgi:hypothetical protein
MFDGIDRLYRPLSHMDKKITKSITVPYWQSVFEYAANATRRRGCQTTAWASRPAVILRRRSGGFSVGWRCRRLRQQFFSEKRTKKLLIFGVRCRIGPRQPCKTFFASLFSKRSVFLPHIRDAICCGGR